MAFCKNCGNNLPDDAMFCAQCGTPVETASAPQTEQTQATPNPQPVQYQETVRNNNTNTQVDFDVTDVQNNKVMGVLSYIWILVLIPIFAAKDSEYSRFHAKQGVKLCGLSIAYSIVTLIINLIVGAIFRPTYIFFAVAPNPVASAVSIILGLGNIFFLALAIIGIINACQGQRKELPILDKLTFIDDLISKFIK